MFGLVKPGIFYGARGQQPHRFHELGIRLGEGAEPLIEKHEHPDGAIPGDERHANHVARGKVDVFPSVECESGVGRHIGDQGGLPVRDGPARDAHTLRQTGLSGHFLKGRPEGVPDNQIARARFHERDDPHLRGVGPARELQQVRQDVIQLGAQPGRFADLIQRTLHQEAGLGLGAIIIS